MQSVPTQQKTEEYFFASSAHYGIIFDIGSKTGFQLSGYMLVENTFHWQSIETWMDMSEIFFSFFLHK